MVLSVGLESAKDLYGMVLINVVMFCCRIRTYHQILRSPLTANALLYASSAGGSQHSELDGGWMVKSVVCFEALREGSLARLFPKADP
jgi:hypothetical protein